MIAWPWPVKSHVVTVARSEAEALAEIHAAAFGHAWSAEEFAALLGERTVFAVGVRRVSRLVGFVLVRVVADEAEILTIAVRPNSRGRGFGRMLMDEALRRLHRAGASACFLEVDRGNAPALALYRSLGFAVAGERRNYYRTAAAGGDGTALVMRVQLR
jgi:[ribosomal protein S18]-alanine N-acetyltransferase